MTRGILLILSTYLLYGQVQREVGFHPSVTPSTAVDTSAAEASQARGSGAGVSEGERTAEESARPHTPPQAKPGVSPPRPRHAATPASSQHSEIYSSASPPRVFSGVFDAVAARGKGRAGVVVETRGVEADRDGSGGRALPVEGLAATPAHTHASPLAELVARLTPAGARGAQDGTLASSTRPW
jgi:hypothetical protein